MSRWLIRIGIACLVIGLLFASPLADLMPVGGFDPVSFSVGSNHFRIVPVEGDWGPAGIALLVLGGLLLLAGRASRRRGS